MRKLFALALLATAIVATVSFTSAAKAFPPPPASCNSPDSGKGGFDCHAARPPGGVVPLHTEAPVFVKSVKNGKRFLGGSGNDTFHVAHIYSTGDDNLYSMGYALGQMFPGEMSDMFNKIEPWLEGMLEKAVPKLPKWLADLVVEYGAPIAIDLVYDITKEYMPKEYMDEWQGMADGAASVSNVSAEKILHQIRRVSLFAQVSKAACTAFVAHEKATSNGGVMQLRALDFDPTSEVADFSAVIVYHYTNKPKLANFGWIAMTGVLTGMSDLPMSVGEKMWGGHNAWLGLPIGIPWESMLRKSLELTSLADVNQYITQNCSHAKSPTPNSVSIHLAYGDQKHNQVIGYEVGYNYSKAFHPHTHGVSPTHPDFDDIVYWSKNDPAETMCPADMIKTVLSSGGGVSAEWLAMYYSPNDMTGDTQVVGFDLKDMKVYYANSRKSTSGGPLCAYYRQRTLLDMKAIFSEPAP